MTTRWARFVRGWLTALVAVFVAAFSHVAGGGANPGPLSVGITLAFAGMVCIALAGKSLSLWRLSLSVVVSQILLHLLFGLGGTGASTMTMTGSHHGAVSVAVDAASATAGHGEHGGSLMWIAHLGAALVTIAALRRGEQAFWSVLGHARSRFVAVLFAFRALVPVSVDAASVRTALAAAFMPVDQGVLRSSIRRRGPPAFCAALTLA